MLKPTETGGVAFVYMGSSDCIKNIDSFNCDHSKSDQDKCSRTKVVVKRKRHSSQNFARMIVKATTESARMGIITGPPLTMKNHTSLEAIIESLRPVAAKSLQISPGPRQVYESLGPV